MERRGEIRIGTSGFGYKEWLGGFYPPKLAASKMLAYYAQRLSTVEINYTFRAIPRRAMLEGWAAETPLDFRFALKASQRITHFARLRGAEEPLRRFVEAAQALGERLGPTLFQLPPDLKCDLALLGEFLAVLGGRLRAAFEFRHRSWFDDRVLEALRSAGAALCIAESEKISSPIERTAPYVYLRLRNESYDERALQAWAERLRSFSDQGADAFVYFKHELKAPELALALGRMVGDRAEAGSPAAHHAPRR